jgi:cell cycle sensor histidine kinase DivJ
MAEDDPKRGDYAKLIGTSARHMLDVVNSFAKEAPEAAHQASLGTEAIHLAELVEESAGIMRLMIATQKASLHYQVEANVPVLVGSRHAFRQILINLMSNALKFAPGGTVLVNVWREGGKVRLTVEDNGMGMTAEDVSRLGEPFFRGTAAGDFAPDGQGLGLGIVRSLVRDHHGDFDVMSRPGAGTRVIVTFQIPEALAAPLPSPAPLAARLPVRRYA